MKCPKCQSETKVRKTMKLERPNVAIRERECTRCHYTFQTIEVVEREDMEAKANAKDREKRRS